ncbi:hypothetical protein OHA02_51260 [Streptomyces phaeochromogenes]|nr:hypothetical protein [Streptomyces phaeochromogenes]
MGTIVVIVIVGGLLVLLAPLVALILISTDGGSHNGAAPGPDAVVSVSRSEGKGELDAHTVQKASPVR